MKYIAVVFFTIMHFWLTGQEQTSGQPANDLQAALTEEGVKKNLELAFTFYKNEDYPGASVTAGKVMDDAAALGLGKQLQEAQKLVILCEQILALQKSREKSEGAATAAIAIQQSELFFKKGEYEKAERYASEAYTVAAEHDDKSFMATALNKEAKAILKKEGASKAEKTEARRKFRKSLQLLTENKVIDPLLKKENLEHLEEFGENIIRSAEFAEARQAIKTAMDSININIENWTAEDAGVSHPGHQVPEGPATMVFDEPNWGKKEKHRELYGKIVELNRERLARELMAPLPPPTPEGINAGVVVGHVTEELKELWPVQLKVLQSDFTENEKRIGKMAPEDIREELLLATYKNRYDSLMHLHILDSINLEKQELAIKQHEAEMERQKARRSFLMTGSGSTLLLALFLFVGFTRQRKNNRLLTIKNETIIKEQERSEELLLNILPAQVAGELKQYGEAKARRYDNVSVLFCDFKDFSKIAENLPPEKLVKELDYCFKAFDRIISKYSLEKIKTIGDAYMCAGGLPATDGNHAVHTVKAAQEMQQFLYDWKEEKKRMGEPYFEARIGIHTGPVVAGVVGMKKFAYDIWGDTVNIASRMESGSEPGRINISGHTFRQIGNAFKCSYRGKIMAKNKGEIDMYFVEA